MGNLGTTHSEPAGRGGRHRRRRGVTNGPAEQGGISGPAAQGVTGDSTPPGINGGFGQGGSGVPSGSHPGPGKAGRNLPAAVGVSLGLAAVVLVPLFVFKPLFIVVIAAAVVVGVWELTRAIGAAEARPPLVPLLVGGVGSLLLAAFTGAEGLVVGLLLTVIAVLLWRIADDPVGFQRDVSTAALVAAYVPFLAGFAVLLTTPDDGHWRVIAFIATVACSDIGGYAAGVLFGKHPMAPSVSPKKSWEGMGGSLLACSVGGVCFLVFLLDGQWWQGVVFGLCLAVAATLGDLAESMIKRDLGIKDMGSLLPGHGGLMDRLDSLLVAAPVAYLLLGWFVPPV
jgi:phosphatidate cytidylyltransferase